LFFSLRFCDVAKVVIIHSQFGYTNNFKNIFIYFEYLLELFFKKILENFQDFIEFAKIKIQTFATV